MPKVQEWLGSSARWIVIALAALAVVASLALLLSLQPPREFTIATGREGGAYYAFAQQYQARFAEEGYTLHIRPTAGSVETIQLLNSGEVDAGFVQNTLGQVDAGPEVTTLAAVFYEALWVFYRADLERELSFVSDLTGLRVNVGEEGSATRASALAILELNGISGENATLSSLPVDEAARRLSAGELDAMMWVAGAAAPQVSELLMTPGIRLMSFQRSDAYTARLKNVSSVVLPQGVVNLARNIPAEDVQLVAARATLVAGPDLHPDLARLLLIIATEIHSPGGILEQPREFPWATFVGIPMNADAARYLENGPTGLERYLPLWLASRLERLLFLLLPVALVIYPILRGLPAIAASYNRYRIRRRYQFLRGIDKNLHELDAAQLDAVIDNLEAWEDELTARLKVPTTMLNELYELRAHSSGVLTRLYTKKRVLQRDGV